MLENLIKMTDEEVLNILKDYKNKSNKHLTDVMDFLTNDFEKTKEYHQNNLEAAIESMEAGISPVIIDNTNTQRWEFQKYLDAAEEFGYDVKIETLDPTNYSEDFIKELAERQKKTHNVPEQVIIDMLKRWED